MQEGAVYTVVQNTEPDLVFVRTVDGRDESWPGGTPENITGWTIWPIVKRHLNDPDTRAIFSDLISPPVVYGFRLPTPPTGVAIAVAPIYGQFAFTFGPAHTELPPGDYFGEMRFWKSGAEYAAGDPPYDKVPFIWRVVQTADLPVPGT